MKSPVQSAARSRVPVAVRFVERDGKVTDVRFKTKRAAREAARIARNVRAAFVLR